ncbi:glycosyl transferase group 1 [Paludibacter propionicigenes WB4]|uniref:Glycosyl transferase group 1 n=1 Tax=Paludibacter propionicigenes (strain DSM 17365 / JCM 13257 / WB4) TaxID=694427 RepID=E4T4N9_PALPW|nr:glycosyltransferase [Paludibacter propionicigenes]ADQ79683.1 glycosyl transferase group 1 [Paludibacter propionicigenes WB4]
MTKTVGDVMKTIGIFNDSFPPIMDGVSLATQNYAYWLNQKKQPVCVITPKSPNYSDNEPYPIYRYTSIPILGRSPYRIGLPEIDPAFQMAIENISFGLVHAHCPFSSGRLALNIARKQKVPFVATFHSKYRDDFEHSVHNKFIAKLMTDGIIRFFEKADEVWIPQASVEETIREYGFKGKVEVVDNGNDFATNLPVAPIKMAARKKLGIADNELMFLFVGQHIWEKNTRLIVETLGEIKDLPFKMFFIGTGYAKAELQELVDKLDLSSKVSFVGVITERDTLKEYYAAADLFLFPSIYDNAPLVVREAGAMQTPSVLVKGSSSAENIVDYYNGFLIEESSRAFAEKLRELFKSPEKIREAGINASQSIARSWESIAEEVLDRYRKLIERKWKR